MNKRSINFTIQVNLSKFYFLWRKSVPTNPYEIDVGEIYGALSRDELRLYIKKTPRGIQTLSDEYLCGTIDENGLIQCRFKRTLESILVTRLLPCLMAVAMLFGYFVIGGEDFLLLCLPSIGLLFCNFIKPTNRRRVLSSYLFQITDQTMKSSD